MRGLLDINVLIALFDPDHVFHERAHNWWTANQEYGWASCPLTENGFVRIMSNPNYSERASFHPGDLISCIREFAAASDHEFWPDNISLLDAQVFSPDRIHSSRSLTDIYLLGLAAACNSRLITFDQNISLSAVTDAQPANIIVV